jgi:hypothetical protein
VLGPRRRHPRPNRGIRLIFNLCKDYAQIIVAPLQASIIPLELCKKPVVFCGRAKCQKDPDHVYKISSKPTVDALKIKKKHIRFHLY